ncbi:ATP-binding protein [Petroclostridium sp. X23]|uniref:ATP-binding protein n=1 Tax=Petroclostridium sp. X23 TaxID=3045146 RepID=UPI0024AD32B4|nr:ATP-binding protein [Petroclostridium sp. X23]WHH58428.1 ATP-binding protein [Petroclostridium sp. X23]
MREYFFNQKGVELLTRANIIANIMPRYIQYSDEGIQEAVKQLEIDKSIRVIITDKEAKVLFDTAENNNLKDKVFLKEEVMKALQGNDVQNHFEEAGWVVNAAVPIIKEKETTGVIYLSASAQDIENFLNDIKKKLYGIALIVSVLIGLLSSFLAGVITAPVEELIAVIKHMADGNLNQKVEVKGNDEIAQLGIAFNKMSERLNQVEEKRRQFVSDASHELRTPLSSIKVLTESILQMQHPDMEVVQEFLSDIYNEVNRLSRIIDKLLMLTKTDVAINGLDLKDVNMRELLQRVVKSLRPLADHQRIKLKLKGSEDIFVLIDEDKIWEAIFNIVDNSIKYTSHEGTVVVSMHKSGFNVEIIVQDNGIGIAETEIQKIFDRFYRVDKARARETGGTGLGLSIALDAVRLHGGDIQVESEEGKGSRFRIIIPHRET